MPLGSQFVTSWYAEVAFVGSEPLHKPCLEAPAPCNPEAIDQLAPGAVYAKWSEVGTTASTPAAATTTPVTVGGRPAQVLVVTNGWCSRYGRTRTVRVLLPATTGQGGLEFDACLRPPGLKTQLGTVEAILHSTTFTTAQ